jgi:predicted metal-dependent HD superfamily phosphohydrolase
MQVIYHAANVIDAQLVVDLLASEGVRAHVQGGFLAGGVGELPAGDLVRVAVAADDALQARAILVRGRDAPGLLDDALDPILERSWERAWRGLGLRPGDGYGRDLRDALVAAWMQPERRYHTLRHLVDCIAELEALLPLAEHPAEVEVALWFHDAVHEARGRDNELRSAAWALRALGEAGVGAGACARIHALVMATRHAAEPEGMDERLIVDVDLAILGASTERFDEYEAEVRQEYAWVPRPVFRAGRREILQGFLARPAIFSLPPMHATREIAARANLQRAIARLQPWWRRNAR